MQNKSKAILRLFCAVGISIIMWSIAAKRAEEQASLYITVSVPRLDGQIAVYRGAKILSQGQSFVKFRTQDGDVIEQHGNYSIERR